MHNPKLPNMRTVLLLTVCATAVITGSVHAETRQQKMQWWLWCQGISWRQCLLMLGQRRARRYVLHHVIRQTWGDGQYMGDPRYWPIWQVIQHLNPFGSRYGSFVLIQPAGLDTGDPQINSCRALFEWLVMPEGLTNAPTAFQWFMNDIFLDMIDINIIVYLDYLLVYSNDLMEHKWHVWEVLQRLHANGLFTHADKCKFHITSCEYLRYMLSPNGLTMAQNKVQIIQDWPEPRKVKDIQSFLGSPTSTIVSSTNTQELSFHSHTSPARMFPGSLLMSVIPPSIHLRRPSLPLRS